MNITIKSFKPLLGLALALGLWSNTAYAQAPDTGASTAPANVAWWDFPGLVERWWKHASRRDGVGIR